jgi:hypothetical protein
MEVRGLIGVALCLVTIGSVVFLWLVYGPVPIPRDDRLVDTMLDTIIQQNNETIKENAIIACSNDNVSNLYVQEGVMSGNQKLLYCVDHLLESVK